MLEVRGLSIDFGGVHAVAGVDLTVAAGEVVALIGPNGAGKTTVFNLLTGLYRPTQGTIALQGHSLLGMDPSSIARLGMVRTFQNIRLFRALSVFDNIRIALHAGVQYGVVEAFLHCTSRFAREEQRLARQAEELLALFGLAEQRDVRAESLPYGQQRRLEIARALATGPRLLLLDEPAAGMNPRETLALVDLLREVRDRFSLTILLIEHDMRLVMNLCERIYVLEYGILIAEGTPVEIQCNPLVIEAYMGEEMTGEETGEVGAMGETM